MVCFIALLIFGCIHAIFEIITHFNLYLGIENDTITIRNKFGKEYIIDKSQIKFIRLGSRRQPNYQSLAMEFIDSSKTYRISMFMYWKEFLLLKYWAEYHKIPMK